MNNGTRTTPRPGNTISAGANVSIDANRPA